MVPRKFLAAGKHNSYLQSYFLTVVRLINLSVHLDHHFRFGIEPCKLLVGPVE